jgi:methyltransferase (TIGR00027 family)
VKTAIAAGTRQLVFLGVDCRPFRLLADSPNLAVFELDRPGMLHERQQVLQSISQFASLHRRQVGIDFSHDDVADVLLATGSFDPDLPTLFILEGVSMHLDGAANARLLRSCGD